MNGYQDKAAIEQTFGIETLEAKTRQVFDRLARCELQWAQLVYGSGPDVPSPADDMGLTGVITSDRFQRLAEALDESIRRLDNLGDRIAGKQG